MVRSVTSKFVVVLVVALVACQPGPTGSPPGTIVASSPTASAPPKPTPTPVPVAGAFKPSTPLDEPRYAHTATLISDGRVLVVGGRFIKFDPEGVEEHLLTSVVLFDPAQEAWVETAPLHQGRWEHSAALLKDGRVLVAGGFETRGDPESPPTAEVYYPRAAAWKVLPDVPVRARTVVTLLDGRVMLVGYVDGAAPNTSSSTVFDPASDTFGPVQLVAGMPGAPVGLLLRDGRVLVAGGLKGFGDGEPEPRGEAAFHDPATGLWTPTTAMPNPQMLHSMIQLDDGRVLVVGLGPSELFDPVTATWTLTGAPASTRETTNLVAVENGHVLAIGSVVGHITALPVVEAYDPATGTWTVIEQYRVIEGQTVTVLADGRILVVGGMLECRFGQPCTDPRVLPDVQLFDPTGRS